MGGDKEGCPEPKELAVKQLGYRSDCGSPVVICFWSLSKRQIVPSLSEQERSKGALRCSWKPCGVCQGTWV